MENIKEKFAAVLLDVREALFGAGEIDPESEFGQKLDEELSSAVERCGNLAHATFGVPEGTVPIRAYVMKYTPSLERDKDGALKPIMAQVAIANTHPNLMALANLDSGPVTITPHQFRLSEEEENVSAGEPEEDSQMEFPSGLPDATPQQQAYMDGYTEGFEALLRDENAKNPYGKSAPVLSRGWEHGAAASRKGEMSYTDPQWEGPASWQGRSAYLKDLPENANPYEPGTDSHAEWHKGWLFGQATESEGEEGDEDAA